MVSSLVEAFIFIGTFAGFPDSMATFPFYWAACYYELAGGLLHQLLSPHVLAQYPLVWWFGALIMLFFPQLLIVLMGGLLTRSMVQWSGKRTGGNGSQSPSVSPLRAGIG
jgi:hypothetical protein